jgi:hypothetical protein
MLTVSNFARYLLAYGCPLKLPRYVARFPRYFSLHAQPANSSRSFNGIVLSAIFYAESTATEPGFGPISPNA